MKFKEVEEIKRDVKDIKELNDIKKELECIE